MRKISLYALFIFLFFAYSSYSQCLNGIYTIGGASPSYTSITAAKNALVANGVCGPVVFNIRAGVYNEQVNLPIITGSSQANSITFQAESLDSNSVVWTAPFSNSNTSYNYVASFPTYAAVKNMTFKPAPGSVYSGTLVLLQSQILFSNNVLKSPYPSIGVVPINALGSASLSIIQNKIDSTGAIVINGHDNLIKKNVFTQCTGMIKSIYITPLSNSTIQENTYTSTTSGGAIVDLYSCNNLLFSRNKFISPATVTNFTSGSNITYENNFMKINNVNGQQLFVTSGTGTSNVGFYYNTIINVSTFNGTVIFPYNFTNVTMLNNVIVSSAYSYQQMSGTPANIDYNCYYTTAAGAGGAAGLAQLYSSYGAEQHSLYYNPVFPNPNDYHIAQTVVIANKGVPVPTYSIDIDGKQRNPVSPDMGCSESFDANDIGILYSVGFDSAFCNGVNPVSVRLVNAGLGAQSQVMVHWEYNHITQPTYTWTGNLASLDSVTVNIGSIAQGFSSGNMIKIWTELPASNADTQPYNDTLRSSPMTTRMSGIYTIGGSSPTFTSIGSAVTALNAVGVCGPTVFKIRDGRYKEFVKVNNVYGASALNTITFESQSLDSTKVLIYDSLDYAFTGPLFAVNNSHYVRLHKLSFKLYPTNYLQPALVSFYNAEHGTVDNCSFIGTGTVVTAVSVAGDGNEHMNFYGGHNYFTGKLNGFGLGAHQTGYTMPFAYNFRVEGNVMDNLTGSSLVSCSNCDSATVTGNTTIGLGTLSALANYLYFGNHNEISNNIYYSQIPAIRLHYNLPAAAGPNGPLIKNNFFNSGSSNGDGVIILDNVKYARLYHNTFRLLPNCYSAIYFNNGIDSTQIINNVFSGKANISYYDMSNGTGNVLSDYNCFSNDSIAYTILQNYSYIKGLNNWQHITTNDLHSFIHKVSFNSPSTYLTTDGFVNNVAKPIAVVANDLGGNARSATPDIGASEFIPTLQANDLGIQSYAPANVICNSQTSYLSMVVKNFGSNPVASFVLNTRIGSVILTPQLQSMSIAPGTAVSVSIPVSSIPIGYNIIKFWVSAPNNATDSDHSNDTLYSNFMTSKLSGTYTIGGASPTFTSVADAVYALNQYGVCGPVAFDIRPGTYRELLSIYTVDGASAINTVTFRSETGLATDVTIINDNSAGIVELFGAEHLVFKNLTFKNVTQASNMYLFRLYRACRHNVFSGNVFIGQPVTTNIIHPIIGFDTGTDMEVSYTVFEDNKFYNGTEGIGYLYSGSLNVNRSNVFKRNYFENQFYYSIGMLVCDSTVIDSNVFYQPNTTLYYSTASAISLSNSNTFSITRNKITGTYTNLVSIGGATSFTPAPYSSEISNNVLLNVSNGSGTGLNIQGCENMTLTYNTIHTTGTGVPLTIQDFYNLDIRNNLVSQANNGLCMQLGGSTLTFAAADHNNYYTGGPNIIKKGTTNYPSLGSYTTAVNMEQASVSLNPQYLSATDLHYQNTSLNGLGAPVAGIVTDQQNKPRDPSTPNPGAYESAPDTVFDYINKDLKIVAITTSSLAPGSNTITFRVKNARPPYVIDTNLMVYKGAIDTIMFSYSANGGAPVTEQWVGSLTQNQVLDFNFTQTLTFTNPKAYYIFGQAKMVSSTMHESNAPNDSLTKLYTMLMADVYQVGVSPTSDFQSVDEGLKSLQICHESRRVTFSCLPGTYTTAMLRNTVYTDTLRVTSYTGHAPDVSLSTDQMHWNNFTIDKITIKCRQYGSYSDAGVETYSRMLKVDSCIVTSDNPSGSNNGFCMFSCYKPVITNNRFVHLNKALVFETSSGFNGMYGGFSQKVTVYNNEFDSLGTGIFTSQGQFGTYSDSVVIRKNTFRNVDFGIVSGGLSGAAINNNDIQANHSAIDIQGASYQTYLFNNFLAGGDRNYISAIPLLYTLRTLVIENSSNVEMYHNSIYGSVILNSSMGLKLLNNLIYGDSVVPLFVYSCASLSSDYNDYFTEGKYIAYYDYNFYKSIDTLQAVYPANEQHSISVPAYYYSPTDLHSNSAFLKHKGTPVAMVTRDIDANIRDLVAPDIGACEINLIADIVWPGDANDDSKVDGNDILSLGLYFQQTGAARSFTTNTWTPAISANWLQQQINGANMKHADCNGDGQVDDSDTAAILLNYDKYHASNLKTAQTSTVSAAYKLYYNYLSVYHHVMGDTVKADIMISALSSQASPIYGIYVNSTVSDSAIKAGTLKLSFDTTLFGANAIKVRKGIEANGVLDFAVVRKNHLDTSGSGKLGRIQFVYSGKTPNNPVYLSFAHIHAINAQGQLLVASGIPSVVSSTTVVPPNGIEELSVVGLSLYPNPASDYFTIRSEAAISLENLIISDALGREVMTLKSLVLQTGENQVMLPKAMANGIYYIRGLTKGAVFQYKLVVRKN